MTTGTFSRVAVAGGGSWGTALAHVLAVAGHDTTLVLRDENVALAINERHENPRYLPGKKVHAAVRATTDISALSRCGTLVLAVPCQHQRTWIRSVKAYLPEDITVVNASKGLENGTCLPMSRVLRTGLFDKLVKMKYDIPNDHLELFDDYTAEIDQKIGELMRP